MHWWVWLAIAIVTLVVGVAIGYLWRRNVAEAKTQRAEEQAKRIVEDARQIADAKRKESVLEAKEEILQQRKEFDQEMRERRVEIQRSEHRIQQREETLDRKLSQAEGREEQIRQKEIAINTRLEDAEALHAKRLQALEAVSGLTRDEARGLVIEDITNEARHDAALLVRDIELRAKEEAEKKARNIIGMAIQKCAADHSAEVTVSVVNLPSDEMKGRIIGREGRNIRALETATGVDLIIDDTPEAVVVSAFDPVRREVARIALEKLIMDGRIHPARIEELVEKARREVESQIREAGESAVLEMGIHNLHPELVKVLGRLKYRTSYGQNVLKHSLEVAHLAAMMAAELGADVQICRRAGLLHDLGKGLDHEIESPHTQIGVDLAKKYRESEAVIHCIAAHHNDIEPTTVEAVLVQAADAISAARPGARRESLQNYIKRLESLENIANSFPGVEKSFAIQAGREVRILVKPEVVSDQTMVLLAKDVARKIESEMEYPGQIRVQIIREMRVTEVAK
nr:ribonuclease Y [bacterium]